MLRFLKNLGRNIRATGLYFLFGIILSAVFQRYVPQDVMTDLFGGNEAWGVLIAATIGVPLYACGGGTIPLLQAWLLDGMSMGSAAAFMLTGPSTKITNLGALKIVLGIKRFWIYLAFVMLFSFTTGLIVNLMI
ncbi:Predicted permease [Marvinbryantia formatexigens]|nr:Predicted permease [Marvinbryantia formatexigens]